MRGFADTDATGVIERLRVTAEEQAEEVTRSAFGGRLSTPPRRAVITHAVAANDRSAVTVAVRGLRCVRAAACVRVAPRALRALKRRARAQPRGVAALARSCRSGAEVPRPARPPARPPARARRQVREWQPSETAAFGALQNELASPEAAAAVAIADAGSLSFPPIFRDYKYES
jgi:hypothetical protein